ncbi:hypothetical protein ACVW16_002752 [Bradyrhizobium sp. USDA 4474]
MVPVEPGEGRGAREAQDFAQPLAWPENGFDLQRINRLTSLEPLTYGNKIPCAEMGCWQRWPMRYECLGISGGVGCGLVSGPLRPIEHSVRFASMHPRPQAHEIMMKIERGWQIAAYSIWVCRMIRPLQPSFTR